MNILALTDPSGKFAVVDSWIVGFIHDFFSKGSNRFQNGWNEANKRAGNDLKMWGGLFTSDKNKNWVGQTWEIISRFTWQLPQTAGGFLTSHAHNTFGLRGGVEAVNYKYCATVLQTNTSWGGVTMGSYIIGGNSIRSDANNPLFQHEYGHYLQSQSMGWAYFARVGIPSILSKGTHDFHPVEQDANRRAFLYFNENVDGFYTSQEDYDNGRSGGWDFESNSLNIYGTGIYGQYIDYRDVNSRQLLNALSLRPKWYDYFDPFGVFFAGWINASYYNKNR